MLLGYVQKTNTIMWQKNLLTKFVGGSVKFNGWSRYITIRKYSDVNKIENNDENVAKSPEEDVLNLLNDSANFNEATDTSWDSSPYPEGVVIPTDKPDRPKQDPSTSTILLFPGQGTLKIGSVNKYLAIPRAKEVFDIANEVVGFDVLSLCLKGPYDKLNRTEYNQVATVTASLAALERLWEDRPVAIEQCKAAVGYSVGELTALIFSGALSLEDGIRLAAVRGAAMQQASDLTPQGMLLIHCLRSTNVGLICDEAKKWAMNMGVSQPVCNVAIYLYSETKVLAGDEESLKYIEKNRVRLDLRKTERLPVSGAFHTSLMEPALKSFKKALDKIDIQAPRIDTYSNVTTNPYSNVRDVNKLLMKQMVSSVKWEQTIQKLYKRPPGVNFPRTFELGSRNLGYILRRINVKASHSYAAV
ncbi:hypothetical protein PV327_007179 [Microctonus hyperodae]|uniref:Malonyl-CoA:ACP transacylase (MAT) domain-containing protein n=1 Tax=Microctonus hyperodae TaxID=165561 RepID=A0AA39F5Z2_MICHY|nr:hypothetical protein PV327_007179 [Microctonus hyperodae]